MKEGDKFEVIMGGTLKTGLSDGGVRLKKGEIWDLVKGFGLEFRKLNKRGGSTCILNGEHVAAIGLSEGRLLRLQAGGAKAREHDALRARTGAR